MLLFASYNFTRCFIFSFSSLQNERNSIHKNLVFCLFAAELIFLIGINRTEEKVNINVLCTQFLNGFHQGITTPLNIIFILYSCQFVLI